MAGRRGKVPRFYFNFRSPYSWIAYRDLMDRYPDVARAVEWHPWWEPDADGERLMNEHGETFPYTPMTREKHLYVLQDVRRLARARGLDISWPLDEEPVWEVPHLAYFPALEAGLGPRYIERVYRARWQEGRDICDPATVADIAGELGLPAERLAGAAEDRELREGPGLAALLALGRDGAFGVPFFLHGYDKFWGVDRLPAFVESVRARARPGAAPRPEPAGPAEPVATEGPPPGADSPGSRWAMPPAAARSGDQGHAGGCG